MELGNQKLKHEANSAEPLSQKSYTKEDQPKLSKRTKAKLGSSALDLNNFLKGTQDYYDEAESHQEYMAAKQQREMIQNARLNYPEYYHDWQIECLEEIKNKRNVILSSPTGSGKTTVFLDWAKEKKRESKENGEYEHTVYITAPIKALSNQRFRELQEAGYMLCFCTYSLPIIPPH